MNRANGCLLTVLTLACASLCAHRVPAAEADAILAASGIRGGLVVVVGCEDAALLADLGRRNGFLVQGFDTEPEVVESARETLLASGRYGAVAAAVLEGDALPLADELVNLLVVADADCGVRKDEMLRVLAPRGVLLGVSGLSDLRKRMSAKPVPPGTDEWTHFRYDATGNMVSQDTRIGPPKYLQWVAGPIFQRHHGIEPSITATVSTGGRIFSIIDEAPTGFVGLPGQWRLVARDAFNGILLWKRDMEDWGSHAWSYWTESHAARFNHPLHVRKRLVAVDGRLYVTLGFNSPITVINAASGKTVRTLDGTRHTDEFVVGDGVVYACVNDRAQKPWDGKGVRPELRGESPEPSVKHVHAIDAASGKLLWKAGPFVGNAAKIDRLASMRHLNLTVSAAGVFLIDEQYTVALELETGKEKWRAERLVPAAPLKHGNPGNLYHHLNQSNTHTVVAAGPRLFVMHPGAPKRATFLQALDTTTGKEVWRYDEATPIAYIEWPDLFVVDDTVWLPDRKAMELVALDAATGAVKVKHSIEKALKVGHHHRCYPNRASVKYAILGRRGAEYVNFATGELSLNHWMRTGCRAGHVLANGFTYRSPDHCRCYMSFQPRGFLALRSERAAAPGIPDSARLVRGPAFASVTSNQPAAPKRRGGGSSAVSAGWPTYRADPMRSSMTAGEVPSQPTAAWTTPLGGLLTPPVVANGKVFVAAPDRHQVIALDAAAGKQVWAYTADARIDSPPSIWEGRVLFGCRDGSVTCLRAEDGVLVWRFKAARDGRLIVSHGQLESPWPVCGSVLAADGKAYFAAGRASVLDGGVTVYALDIATGQVLATEKIHEIQTDTRTTGALPSGALSDILCTDGECLRLGRRQLSIPFEARVSPTELAATGPVLTADAGFANERWFHRAFWNLQAKFGSASGNLIAFDAKRAYVAAANHPGGNNQTFHIPSGGSIERVAGRDGDGPSWLANPNVQVGGTVLYAARSRTSREDRPAVPDTTGRKLGKGAKPAAAAIWRHDHFPMYPWAMLCGDGKLVVAGPPGEVDTDAPWSTFEGKGGGRLCVLDADSGEILSGLDLPAPPAWNGMAAAGGKLYLALRNGELRCYARGQ